MLPCGVNKIRKLLKEVGGVVWARSCFGMILNGEDWIRCGADTLDGLVVEVDMSDLNMARKGVRISCKAMIL